MKKQLLLLSLSFCLFTFVQAQEFADFEFSAFNQGTGSFSNAVLSDFTWIATGTINGAAEILDDEWFDDGNEFENTFGQANDAENLRIQIYPNGYGTIGQPIVSKSKLTINFNEISPADGWGFCIVDIDVENCLISAIDENDNEVAVEDIDDWLIELFDTDLISDGLNIPKWDATNAALLGFNTPEDYLVYNNLVIGGLDDSEAASAFFMPDIPLKTLIIDHENLQDDAYVSYHFYIASMGAASVKEIKEQDFSVYPNPCYGKIQITNSKIQNNLKFKTQNSKLEILDLHGKVAYEEEIGRRGEEEISVDVSHLPAGLYLVKLQTGDAVGVRKIIIQ